MQHSHLTATSDLDFKKSSVFTESEKSLPYYRNHTTGSHPEVSPSRTSSLRSILILHFHLRLDLENGLFPSHFPTKLCSNFDLCSTCSGQLIFHDFITQKYMIQNTTYETPRYAVSCSLLSVSGILFKTPN